MWIPSSFWRFLLTRNVIKIILLLDNVLYGYYIHFDTIGTKQRSFLECILGTIRTTTLGPCMMIKIYCSSISTAQGLAVETKMWSLKFRHSMTF